ITKRFCEILWLWLWLISVDDGVVIDATGAGISGAVSGNIPGCGATLGGRLTIRFANCSAGTTEVLAFPAGDWSFSGVAGVSPGREIAARFSFRAANSANRDSTTSSFGFVTAAGRSAEGSRTPALDSFTLLTGAAGAASVRRSASGSAEL